jgi:type II secretory pathway component PulF
LFKALLIPSFAGYFSVSTPLSWLSSAMVSWGVSSESYIIIYLGVILGSIVLAASVALPIFATLVQVIDLVVRFREFKVRKSQAL